MLNNNLGEIRRLYPGAESANICATMLGTDWRTGSVRRDSLLGIFRFPPLDRPPIRGQSGVANLVKQGAVADAQCTRGLLAVPVTILQNFQNNFPLQLADRL